MFLRETKIAWHALDSLIRTDFLKKITLVDVHYNYRNLGLGLWEEVEKIFSSVPHPSRILPYLRPF